MADDTLWQTKLHARLHDPAEKALVLLRDPAGHEGGTSRALHRLLGFDGIPESGRMASDSEDALDTVLFKNGFPAGMYRTVQRADWWASAADRPQWPMEEATVPARDGRTRTRAIAEWAQVHWARNPTLIHPLNGKKFDLGSLADTDFHDVKDRSRTHFERLVVPDGDAIDWRRTLLAFWRFGPELREEADNGTLGQLWPLLPADTRIPDHSIWDHLDLVSAFAGAFTADPDGDAALLALSIGPVQSFIAAARSTSDLWAGSHLLARLSWEAAKVVCERLGPDAVLFPRLRGIPQVDVWLRDECGLPREWFAECDWTERETDANPLFSAALPNRFVAVVPAGEAREIAGEVEARARSWLKSLGDDVVDRLLSEASLRRSGDPRDETVYAYRQMREQLDGFPEVHWAAVPFSLIRPRDGRRQTDLDTSMLSEAMAPFFKAPRCDAPAPSASPVPGAGADEPIGFLDSPAWRVLQEDRTWSDGTRFFAPNPGVLYPAVYDLAERVLAAAKAVRPFAQMKQRGWRCSLTGETEWLTTDEAQLDRSYRGQEGTLWAKLAKARPAWAKAGEHLGALPAVKRLWPTLFAEEVAGVVGMDSRAAGRFVVSTHTMALAKQIEARVQRAKAGEPLAEDLRAELGNMVSELGTDPVALPRKLMREIRKIGSDPDASWWAKRLPGLLDAAAESGDEDEQRRTKRQRDAGQLVKRVLGRDEDKSSIEAYYALLLMDGDHMGRILSGDEDEDSDGPGCAISYLDSLHPQVRDGFEARARENPALKEYGGQTRAISPNRHLAISGALNDFALHVVPEVIEHEYLGRVLYAGGDDVMAMLPVADLLPAMRRLRCAYSGHDPRDASIDWKAARASRKLVCKDGFALLPPRSGRKPGSGSRRGHLMRMMGGATASCGAVVAHHQAPLTAVMRELREAEQRAKNEGGRNAFSLTVVKRSGGVLHLTADWGKPLELLLKVRGFLADPSVSRRAVYNSLVWLKDLPEDASADMLGSLLGYQFNRQMSARAKDEAKAKWKREDVLGLACRVAGLAAARPASERRDWLERFLGAAEFLARETRLGPAEATGSDGEPSEPAARSAAGG